MRFAAKPWHTLVNNEELDACVECVLFWCLFIDFAANGGLSKEYLR